MSDRKSVSADRGQSLTEGQTSRDTLKDTAALFNSFSQEKTANK